MLIFFIVDESDDSIVQESDDSTINTTNDEILFKYDENKVFTDLGLM